MPFWRRKDGKEAEDRLGTLSRRLDDVESKVRTIGLEWNDTIDRLERLVGRFTKRAQRALAAEEAPEPDRPSPRNGSGAPPQDEVTLRRSRLTYPSAPHREGR